MTRETHPLLVFEFGQFLGGAERQLEYLGEGFAEIGQSFSVLGVGRAVPGGADMARRLAKHAHRVELAERASRRDVARFAKTVRASHVHWSFAHPFAFGAGSWLFSDLKVPHVVTEHLPGLRAGPRWEAMRWCANSRIGRMIVVSDSAGTDARRHWRRPPRLTVVRNGVRLPRMEVPVTKRAQPALVVVGRLEDQKNPMRAIELLRSLHDHGCAATLTFVGDGSLRPRLAAAAKDAGLTDEVRFTGYMEDPSTALSESDVFLSTAKFEGLPLAPLEAVALGLRAVLSPIGPHREIAAISEGVELPAEDIACWRDAVQRAFDSGRLSGAALERVRQEVSLKRMAEQTAAVYRMVEP